MKIPKWLKTSPYGMLLVIKPRFIGLFILIWNFLIGSAMLASLFFTPKGDVVGLFFFFLTGLYVTFIGIAPFISQKYKIRWCRPDADFATARVGLVFLALFGCMILIQCLVWSRSMLVHGL